MEFNPDLWPMLVKDRFIMGGNVRLRGANVTARKVAGDFFEGRSVEALANEYETCTKAIEEAIRYAVAAEGTSLCRRF
jgi:uncharacterized protein (DUF433 family)